MDEDKNRRKASQPGSAPAQGDLAQNPDVEQFFERLSSDLRRPKPSQDAIAAALHAVQSMALESLQESGNSGSAAEGKRCQICGYANREEHKFCAACGAPFVDQAAQESSITSGPAEHPPMVSSPPIAPAGGGGQHYYHHHYHHHYFQPEQQPSAAGARPGMPAAAADSQKDGLSAARPLGKSEAALRKMTQGWALACNTRQLDELLDFYGADALVLRSNTPPIRGTAAIREFFYHALDAGLGEVEMDPLRVEVAGDFAYEAGRCKMLVPVVVGKRREERGKYLLVFQRQAAGNWKAVADCWSSDLSLGVNSESDSKASLPPQAGGVGKPPRKSA